MILFLAYYAKGERGGEHSTGHLHEFLKRKYRDIIPQDFYGLGDKPDNPVGGRAASLKLIQQYNPDLTVVDVSSGARNISAIRWAKKHGKKVLVIVQDQRMNYKFNNFFLIKWYIRRCERYLTRNADIFFTISDYTASLARNMAGKSIPTVIARPGLQFAATPGELPASGNETEGTWHILNVGEPSERKGTKYLVEAMASLKDLDIHLHITGGFDRSNPYNKKVMEIVKRNCREDRITFHGFIDRKELIALYKKSALFLQPSLSEGYGMAMAEALTFGLPVIASDIAAIPEMIENGVNGTLVRPRDPGAIADAIRALLNDPELRAKIRTNNIQKAAQLARWDHFDAALESGLVPLISEIVGLKPVN